ncbi:MAG: hypothetical protein K2N47_01700 [Clostridia bacterium]|nr:hypothetical protein [Clostridia bacterium]
MGKKSKKIDIISIVIFAVLIVALAMTIVGICIDWTTSEIFNVKGSSTLSELLESQKKLVDMGADPNTTFNTNAAFSIMTIIFTGLTTIAFAAKLFVKNKMVKFVTLILAALSIVCAVVAISTIYSYLSDLKTGISVGAGPWLLFAFGVLGGAAGVVGALKK